MAQKLVIFDDAVGQYRASTTTIGSISSGTDTDFDVGGGGQSAFTPSTFTSLSKIDVYVNGRLQREGGTNDFTRTVGTQTITTTFTIPQGSWVRIRVT